MDPPKSSWLKLNFDGASKYNGKASGGGVIKNDRGELVATYVGGLGLQCNNFAEALTLLWGVKLAITLSIQNLHIEGDSKLIIDAVTKGFYVWVVLVMMLVTNKHRIKVHINLYSS